jgi:hypothetical protein
VVMMYRIVHHLIAIPSQMYLTPATTRTTRGHGQIFQQKSTIKSDYNVHLEYFFFFFQWSSSLSDPQYYQTCDMYIRRQGMWFKNKNVIFTVKTMWMF